MTKKYKVFIQGPGWGPYARMFHLRGNYERAESIHQADIVVFTGGPDVDPKYYEEDKLPQTSFNISRDDDDIAAYGEAFGKFKVGICRGAQLLNVMNGGSMWQHVVGHTAPHMMHDLTNKSKVWVSSTHHQAMIPHKDRAEIIGVSFVASEKHKQGESYYRPDIKSHMVVDISPSAMDYEVLYYPEDMALCYQPHPELPNFGHCKNHFFATLSRLLVRENI